MVGVLKGNSLSVGGADGNSVIQFMSRATNTERRKALDGSDVRSPQKRAGVPKCRSDQNLLPTREA